MTETTLVPENEVGEPEPETGKMSFLEHLDELRKRLTHIVLYLCGGFLAALYFSKSIYGFLAKPLIAQGVQLIFTKPTDAFVMYMKVAFIASIFDTIHFGSHLFPETVIEALMDIQITLIICFGFLLWILGKAIEK